MWLSSDARIGSCLTPCRGASPPSQCRLRRSGERRRGIRRPRSYTRRVPRAAPGDGYDPRPEAAAVDHGEDTGQGRGDALRGLNAGKVKGKSVKVRRV